MAIAQVMLAVRPPAAYLSLMCVKLRHFRTYRIAGCHLSALVTSSNRSSVHVNVRCCASRERTFPALLPGRPQLAPLLLARLLLPTGRARV